MNMDIATTSSLMTQNYDDEPEEASIDGNLPCEEDTNEENQDESGKLISQGNTTRPRTRKAVSTNVEYMTKKREQAGKALKCRISRLDELLREQCTDIMKLTAGKDGLKMDMNDFKRYHEELCDLQLVDVDNESAKEDFEYFDFMRETYLQCLADVKTRINDLTQERAEMFSRKSSSKGSTSKLSGITKLSSRSTTSSRQASANAAALKEKMASLVRQQEQERKKDELLGMQKELERKEEHERSYEVSLMQPN